MAVSRIGLGWPVEERDYATIAAWVTARGGSGVFEEGILRGSVTTANTNINGAFSAGALLRGFIEYDGSNEDDIAHTGGNHNITITSNNVVLRDLRILYAQNFNFAATATGSNSFFERCRIAQTGTGNAGVANMNSTALNKGFRRCVISANGNLNSIQSANGRDFVLENNVIFGYSSATIPTATGGDADKIARGNFCLEDTGSTFADPADYTEFDNNASLDGTGNVTGYGSDEFVDFANKDYRIKSTSDLHSLEIGAFFQESGGEPDIREVTFDISTTTSVELIARKSSSTQLGLTSGSTVDLTSVKSTESSLVINSGSNLDLTSTKSAAATLALTSSSTVEASVAKLSAQTLSAIAATDLTLATTKSIAPTLNITNASTIESLADKLAQVTANYLATSSVNFSVTEIDPSAPDVRLVVAEFFAGSSVLFTVEKSVTANLTALDTSNIDTDVSKKTVSSLNLESNALLVLSAHKRLQANLGLFADSYVDLSSVKTYHVNLDVLSASTFDSTTTKSTSVAADYIAGSAINFNVINNETNLVNVRFRFSGIEIPDLFILKTSSGRFQIKTDSMRYKLSTSN